MKYSSHIITAIVGVLIGAAGVHLYAIHHTAESDRLIRDYYATEVAVSISPHSLRKEMDKGESKYLLVDLRSPQEYEKEHIVGAINIPAYSDPDTSAYQDQERIESQFRKAITENPGKTLVTYCYSIPCMTSKKIGNFLAQRDIFVAHLNIGWNEWRYEWTMWNHEHEWKTTDVMEYIAIGTEPGVPKTRPQKTDCTIGVVGC